LKPERLRRSVLFRTSLFLGEICVKVLILQEFGFLENIARCERKHHMR